MDNSEARKQAAKLINQQKAEELKVLLALPAWDEHIFEQILDAVFVTTEDCENTVVDLKRLHQICSDERSAHLDQSAELFVGCIWLLDSGHFHATMDLLYHTYEDYIKRYNVNY